MYYDYYLFSPSQVTLYDDIYCFIKRKKYYRFWIRMHYSSICFIDWNGHINYKRHASSWKRRGNLCLDSKGKHIDLELSWHDKIPVVCQTFVYQRFFIIRKKCIGLEKITAHIRLFFNAIIRKCWIIKTKSSKIIIGALSFWSYHNPKIG